MIPMTLPARHRETAGKIQLPAVQRWGAEQVLENVHHEIVDITGA
ncbi:hypothetical protein [Mesobacterium pallidum]|nr:hypothetical protein [Mesobacterium pallidum]